MKKNVLKIKILILGVLLSNTIFCQCGPVIPAIANVVNTTQTVNGGFTPQWVCTGDTLNSDGGSFNVYLEPGAVMNTGGGIDSIYVKAGAYLNMNGGIHQIILEPMSNVSLLGGIPYLDTCVSIHYNYSFAPAAGCIVTSTFNTTSPSFSFTVSPNPFTSQTTITFSEAQKNTTIKITDLLGKKIKTIDFKGKELIIDKGEMQSGIYFVQTIDEQKNIFNKKIVIQ